MSGAELIAAERRRQMDVEGWTPEHDDAHDGGELVNAALAYCMGLFSCWPWDTAWWKPSPDDRVRELVKAGALIAAEIDRIQRVPVCEVLGDGQADERVPE